MVFHIVEKEVWEEAKENGLYKTPSLDSEGFIHFSKKEQVIHVANLIYKGKTDLILLCVDENKTKHEMIFEDLKGHGIFPHLYGPLNIDSVINVVAFPCSENGYFDLPKELG